MGNRCVALWLVEHGEHGAFFGSLVRDDASWTLRYRFTAVSGDVEEDTLVADGARSEHDLEATVDALVGILGERMGAKVTKFVVRSSDEARVRDAFLRAGRQPFR